MEINRMKKLLFCIGTRPEAIKLAPLILEARARGQKTVVLVTGQHREMLVPFLKFFGLVPDHNLDVLKPNQSLAELSSAILSRIHPILLQEKPDFIFVQGDTTTAVMSALAGFYEKTPVVHVEAGLRTFDRYSPFPEEMNRKLIGSIAEWHFAPTEQSKQNLAKEGLTTCIFVTGNTGVDALRLTTEKIKVETSSEKIILVTCHRRENHGKPLEEICDAILEIVHQNDDVRVVFPVHLNPNVQQIVRGKLLHPRITLCEPLGYEEFASLMKQSYLLLTDSGGIQEEAPYLKKPIFVMRESTERPEGIEAGVSILVGSDRKKIVSNITRALTDATFYAQFQKPVNPYGDGFASQKILDLLGL